MEKQTHDNEDQKQNKQNYNKTNYIIYRRNKDRLDQNKKFTGKQRQKNPKKITNKTLRRSCMIKNINECNQNKKLKLSNIQKR